MGSTTAAIVWGVPVKPAELLCNLDAFRKAISPIHSLRLCNQFGKGENVGITKLPKELIGFIEEELLALLRQQEEHVGRGWHSQHRCFEGTCRPSDHMDDVGFPSEAETYDSMVEDALTELLKTHSDWRVEDWRTDEGFDLPVDVQKLVDAEIAAQFDNYRDGIVWEYCRKNRDEWPSNVCLRMESQGNNDVLRKHFGLRALIMDENLDDATIEYLQRTDRRYSQGLFELEKATICYLILPPQTAKWRIHLDRDCDDFSGESARSMLIDRNSLDLTEEHRRLFTRAMSRLAFKPSVHPSQLRATLSAAFSVTGSSSRHAPPPATDKNPPAEEKSRKDAIITNRVKALNEKRQWY
ncbi:hypothetical protein KCU77_g11685, partial [Aureobasidium melanogenum]